MMQQSKHIIEGKKFCPGHITGCLAESLDSMLEHSITLTTELPLDSISQQVIWLSDDLHRTFFILISSLVSTLVSA